MLKYMLDHSRHHMDEFEGITRRLREEGQEGSAENVEASVSLMKEADVILERAIDLLESKIR